VPRAVPWLRLQSPPGRTQRADFPHYALLFTSRQGSWDLSRWGRFRLGDTLGVCPGLGLAQGSPLSPALANLYLLEVDRYFHQRLGRQYIRYLDDLLVVVPGKREEAEAVLAELQGQLALLGLGLNNKTQILSAGEAVRFLGLDIKYSPGHRRDG